ncbi:MAG TPA: hypothetical protein VGT44_21100, partial [Ktedonobacteraceae bacterium]|nr:hypothetical protein [Ktedonobacteraceae bacterium]
EKMCLRFIREGALPMLPTMQNESLQSFAEKITQTRMDLRLAKRAGLRSTAHKPASSLYSVPPTLEPVQEQDRLAEVPLEEREYLMEPLVLKEGAIEPEIPMETIVDDEGDDTWLNDRVPIWREPAPHLPILKEQSIDDQALTCWLSL